MKYILIALILFAQTVIGEETPQTDKQPLVAVMDVINNTNQHHAFVKGIPDMLITELLEEKTVHLVERSKVKTAMKALNIPVVPSDSIETPLQLGKWLGADQVMVGAFNKLGHKYRLDIRVINVFTGKIDLAASALKSSPHLIEIVPDIGKQLRFKLGNRQGPSPVNKDTLKTSILKIDFKMVVGFFTESPVPVQKVKVFLNEKCMHTSSQINELNRYFSVFEQNIVPGFYTIRLEHGVVDTKGVWKKSLEQQPAELLVHMKKGEKTHLRYRMKAGDRYHSFSQLVSKN